MDAKERKVFNSRPLFFGFLALMLAIASARNLFAGKIDWIVISCVVLVAFVVYSLWAKKYSMMFILLSVFAFGIGWFFVGQQSFQGHSYTQICQIEGRVTDDLAFSSYGGNAYVTLKDVKINSKTDKNIALTICIDDESQIQVGDKLSFEAKVNNASLFELGSANSWFYRDKTPYTCTVDVENISIIGNHLTVDEKFRLKAKAVLYENMGEQNGSVAYAVLFGNKSDVHADVKQAYKDTGIIHLLTVSGLHFSFLIGLLGFILKKCHVSGIWNFLVCAIVLFAYAYVCGFSPSVVRAGIMGLVLLGAKLSGKCYDGLNSIGLAGVILLLWKPLFAFDIGFLMSFFCVISIYVVAPMLSKVFKKFLPKWIAEGFAISIATQIGILPFLSEIFSTFNFLSFFINLLIIPFFGILFPMLFVFMFMVMTMPFLGFMLKVCGWGFDLIYVVAKFFSGTSLKTALQPMNIIVTVLMFLLFFLLSKYFMSKKKVKAVCSGCVLALIVTAELVFSFLTPSVGVSCAYYYDSQVVMLTNSRGETLFVGCGSASFNRRLMNTNFVKNPSTLLLMQNANSLSEDVVATGFENVYNLKGNISFEEETEIGENEVVSVDGFAFVYKFYNSQFVGVEVLFDQTAVFVLNVNSGLSHEIVQSVVSNDYEFVMLGRHEEFAVDFYDSSGKILTYYDNKYSTISYQTGGNMTYALKGNKFKRRIID